MKLARFGLAGRRSSGAAEAATDAPVDDVDAEAAPPAAAADDRGDAVRINRSAVVLLRADGVSIPRSGTVADEKVPLWGLDLLVGLAGPAPMPLRPVVTRIAEGAGVTPMAVHLLLKRLDARGFVSRDAGASVPAAPLAGPSQREVRPVDPSTGLVVGSPRLLRVAAGRFEALDNGGSVLAALRPVELAAVGAMTVEPSLDEAFRRHRDEAGARGLDDVAFEALATTLLACGILEREDECRNKAREQALFERAFGKAAAARESLEAHFASAVAAMDAAVAATGTPRAAIVPIHTQHTTPLSLGMIVAYATAFEEGRLLDDYAFLPSVFFDRDHLSRFIDEGAVFLFSDYVWSHGSNLESSHALKQVNPRCLVVHGGPDVPKYEADVHEYLAANPFVDVIVHGEGERTFSEMLAALAAVVHDAERDLSVLAEVPGLSFRLPSGEVVRTGERERLTDVNEIPSPYLTGVYEAYGNGAIDTAMIETNRGCPYSCTFCDWGSSTASRIRKFDLDRIFAELEWCARNKVERIFVCDANFGIFERDVEIARKVADLRLEHGYPKTLGTNYAKNTVKHLKQIVQIMAEGGIITEGLLSLQSMDEATLTTIRRSNIKVEKYDALAKEFRDSHLPLMVDLMIGLPGSTTASLREDFQQCIDREVNAKVFQTELLVNSPMNEPEYREENAIEIERTDGQAAVRIPTRGAAGAGRALVVSASSFTRADYDEMLQMRAVFRLVENFAVLRLVARFVRQEVGVRETDLIDALRVAAHEEPDRWPHLAIGMRIVPEHMVPPVAWAPFVSEIRDFVVERLGVAPSSALDAVLAAQTAVLPGPARSFPDSVDIAHDVGAWYAEVLRAKDAGHRTDWPEHVPHLATYPATSFVVEDPTNLCEVGIGFGVEVDPYANWELTSPVSRVLAAHTAVS